MSLRWPNGIVNKTFTPPTTGLVPSASGIWNMQTQADYQSIGGWPNPFTAIEDVFSTYLYTGNGSTQTITNGIDLAGQGGMVWLKARSSVASHAIADTVRGNTKYIGSDGTWANQTISTLITSFNSNGFTLGNDTSYTTNTSGVTVSSWTFRKAPKFFDVVTYTGNGSARTISHSLGSTPGMVIVKCTSTTSNWAVYHRSQTSASYYTKLNLIDAQASDTTVWNGTAPTSSVFSVGTSSLTNTNGDTYVAYLFAHDTTTDGLIQCGGFNGATDVNLGWEPQYLLIKRADSTGGWFIWDTMRGLNATGNLRDLYANLSNAEADDSGVSISSTGFTNSAFTGTYIYMAIRRGPMRTPTDATKVFKPVTYTGNSSTQSITTNFAVDMEMVGCRNGAQGWEQGVLDRMRGNGIYLSTASTAAETNAATNMTTEFQSNTGTNRTTASFNYSGLSFIDWAFQRAPGFFDVVCYTGTGVARTVNHNLGVAPELMIVKSRSNGSLGWYTYSSALGNTQFLVLNTTDSAGGPTALWNSTTPTSSVFSVSGTGVNQSSGTYVAYLFASCPGVSKVGIYTGTGSTQTISCGFTGGARFVLIKRTDSTGDWYVWDTARGMVAGTDPSLLLNSTAVEVNANSVYTTTGGFQIVSTAAGINASGGSYIFLAVA